MKMYEISRDGFAFLVMGYTGAKATQFKEVLPPVNVEPTLHRKVNPLNRKIILTECFWKMDPPPCLVNS
jgi:hypothetical protein